MIDDHDPYIRYILVMGCQLLAYTHARPEKKIEIQFPKEENVGIIGTITDGIRTGIITVNEDAKEMFNELGWIGHPAEPTLTQLRTAIQIAYAEPPNET